MKADLYVRLLEVGEEAEEDEADVDEEGDEEADDEEDGEVDGGVEHAPHTQGQQEPAWGTNVHYCTLGTHMHCTAHHSTT